MKRQFTVRFQMFITLIALFLIPTFLLCIVGYCWMRSNIESNAEASYNATMQNVSSRFEHDLKTQENIVTLFRKTRLLKKLTYMQGGAVDYNRINVDELYEYKNQLLFHCAGNPLFDEITVCFPTKNLVISSRGVWQLDWYLQDEFHASSISEEEWKKLLAEGGSVYEKRISSFGQDREGMIWTVPGEFDYQGNALMSVIFFSSDTTLKNYLQDLILFPETSVGLYSPAGNVIQAIEGKMNAQMLSSAYKDRSGISNDMKVFETEAQPSGLYFCAFVPECVFYGDMQYLMIVVGVILMTMTLIGILLSWELSEINYRPMKHLLSTLGTKFTQKSPTKKEMEDIEGQLLNILSEQEKLKDRMDENREVLQYAALTHLLDGDESFKLLSHEQSLELLDLPMPYEKFAVALLADAVGIEKVSDKLKESQNEKKIKYYPLMRQEQIVIVCNWQSSIKDMQAFGVLSSMCSCVCISRIYNGAKWLSKAMLEAKKAMSVRPLFENIYFYEENPSTEVLYYPQEHEKLLLSSLRDGNTEKSLEIYDELLAKNNRADTREKLFIAIEWTMIKTDDGEGSLAKNIETVVPSSNLETRSEQIRDFLKQTSEFHQQRMETVKSAFAQEMLSFVDDHITDEQLSLSSLAEHLHVSTSYLSRYFKEQVHTGYLDYVNRKRIFLAKQMMSETSMSIREISIATGFGNDASFRRVFKKYEGVVPSRLQQEDDENHHENP